MCHGVGSTWGQSGAQFLGGKLRLQRGLRFRTPLRCLGELSALRPLILQCDPVGEGLSLPRRSKCRHLWPLSGLQFHLPAY